MTEEIDRTISIWQSKWNDALALWTHYARLQNPIFCISDQEEQGLGQGIAMIRLKDLQVVLSIKNIISMGLEDLPLEILAHEIGHHIYCPADLTDLARLTARVQKGLMDLSKHAPMVLNLYTDLLVNHRLKTESHLPMEKIYYKISQNTQVSLWTFYMRIYEILWGLPRRSLAKSEISDEIEGDAQLANRIIKNSAKYWLKGAGQFAVLCYSYLAQDGQKTLPVFMKGILDTRDAGAGDIFPDGILQIDDEESKEIRHPAYEMEENFDTPAGENQNSKGNYREPFQFGQILEAIGIKADTETIAMAYYKQRALPYLIPFPQEKIKTRTDPLPEGLAYWDAGSSFSQIDWFESISRSPVLIPGYTLLEREYGETQGSEPDIQPVDLDLYIDSSGSMPNPTVNTSFLTLAGAIIALSALRSGSRVQATLWSGVGQVVKTEDFTRDEKSIFKVLTGFFGGATAFPIHVLRETYQNKKQKKDAKKRKVHILIVSDDGVTTMFDNDEKGNNGKEISKMSLENAEAGGTMVLNLWRRWQEDPLLKEAHDMGWKIFPISQWEDLLDFSREFARKHYSQESSK